MKDDLSGTVTVVDRRGHETVRHINADGDMIPLPPSLRGGAPRDKAKTKAARRARRKNR